MRKIEIEVNDVLDLIVAAETYGYEEVAPDLVCLIGGITDKDILDFCVLTDEKIKQGYTKEDQEFWTETLKEYQKEYNER